MGLDCEERLGSSLGLSWTLFRSIETLANTGVLDGMGPRISVRLTVVRRNLISLSISVSPDTALVPRLAFARKSCPLDSR